MSGKARTGLLIFVAAGVAIGGGIAVWVGLRGPEPPPAVVVAPEPAPEPDSEATGSVVVESVRGKVEARRGGGWVVATKGSALNEKDAIRTAAGAEAVLAVGTEGSRVVVRERSAVSVREVKSEVARVRLEFGRIGADLKGKLVLQVESEGSETVAEAKKGRFSVFNNGKGLVAVAAETASVALKTPRGTTKIDAGKQVTIKGNRELARQKIPQAVFLNVNWPSAKTTKAKSIAVQGRANPGSEVQINGRLAVVDAGGTFTVQVPLREGSNSIQVEATDALGRKKRARKKVTAYHRAPEVDADGREMWK